MSMFKKNRNQQKGIVAAVGDVGELVNVQGSELKSINAANVFVSAESVGADMFEDACSDLDSVMSTLKPSMESALGFSLSDSGAQAASIICAAGARAADYMTQANMVSVEGLQGADFLDGRDTPAYESFDSGDLDKMLPKSIVFNAVAGTQDEFGEAFFPTTVVTPDQQGFEVKLERTMVFNGIKRANDGTVTDFNKKSVIDALVDHTVLESTAGKIIPVAAADDSNAAHFVDSSVVARTDVEVEGVAVKTGPLKAGATFDLLALSKVTGSIGSGVLDHTDQVAPNPTLSAIYVRVHNAVDDKSSVHKVVVAGMPRTTFLAAQEGESRDTTLNFVNSGLSFTAASKDISGAAGAGMEIIPADHTAKVSVKLIGEINLDTGSTNVVAQRIGISGLYNADGQAVPITTGAGKAVADDFIVEFLGYDLDSSRSNTNMRTAPLLVESSTRTEKYPIKLGAPIAVQQPVGTEAATGSEIKSLINIAHARTCNNAVTKLLNYADTLEAYEAVDGEVADIEGIGRLVVKPTFITKTIDFATDEVLNTMRSHEKREDVQAVLVDALRSALYEANRQSNYSAALHADGDGSKPSVVIGTDEVLAQYLMVSGDERTLAIGFENNRVVTTPDSRMEDTIFATFSRGQSGGDPLSFGSRAYVPELTSTQEIQFNNSVKKQTTVQPREGHFCHLPIMVKLVVKNLEVVLGKKS